MNPRPGESVIEFCARRVVEQEPAEAVKLIVRLTRREAELLEENKALRQRRWLAPAGAEGRP